MESIPSQPNVDSKSNKQTTKKSRDAERRRRRGKQKKNKSASGEDTAEDRDGDDSANVNSDLQKVMEQVEIEYIPEKAELEFNLDDEFRKVFEKFTFRESAASEENGKSEGTAFNAASNKKASSDSEEEEPEDQQKEKGGISNKKKKGLILFYLGQPSLFGTVKSFDNSLFGSFLHKWTAICCMPTQMHALMTKFVWDATSADPKLLVFLKSYRNTVPVPRHWCQKRKFLQGPTETILEPGQGKRGIEKQPFQLPDFIAATGIQKIRQAYIEKEDNKKLKQKQRERMQPKMGKMDIDYQI
ncbi:hypothetical protein L1987_38491 [Smallanthus sonchifolius]|uniref:Uncharacterized protein n=1 Tax=Smallanthus sonchifolius TaxID=185202 RepID=A0ACB9HK27_9ASTR|nr:hypothetical protein L1987_38491 [Smallanthus sonchifolius]